MQKSLALELEGVRKLQIREVAVPSASAEDVVIRVTSAGICGSDLAAIRGTHPFRNAPLIVGHECGGIVVEIGTNVVGITVGDHVVVEPQVSCGECQRCESGLSHLCPHKVLLGTAQWPGAVSEYITAPYTSVIRAPKSIPLEHLSVVEPLAVACHAVRISPPSQESKILVLGGGSIGMLVCQVLAAFAPRSLDVIERRDALAEGLKHFGATSVMDQLPTDAPFLNSYDRIYICASAQELVNTALVAATARAKVCVVALYGSEIEVPFHQVQSKELHVMGSAVYSREDFDAALTMLAEKPEVAEQLVSEIIPLTSAPERVMRLLDDQDEKARKLVVQPG